MNKLIVFLFTAAIFSLSAQNVINLDLQKSLELALEGNHDIKKAALNFEKAEEQVNEAYGSSLFPSIEGTGNYARAIKKPVFVFDFMGQSQTFEVGSDHSLTFSVNAEQPLFTGAMFLAVRIAQTFADISKENADFTKVDIISKVKEAYYTILLSKNLVKLSELQLNRAEENLKNTESMYKAGLVSEYDFLKAKVQYQNSIPVLSNSKTQYNLSENNLKILLGLDLDQKININDSLEYKPKLIPNYEDGLDITLSQNKLLKQVELDAEMKDLVASYEFTKHFPELNAYGNWQTQSQENDPRSFTDWRYKNSFSVGLNLRVPIFKGFTIDSKVEQAEIDHKIALEELYKTEKTLKNQYENILANIGDAKQKIDAYKSALGEADKAYSIAKKRYETGLGTQLELTDSIVGLTRAEYNYQSTVYEYNILLSQLDLVLGKSINELLTSN